MSSSRVFYGWWVTVAFSVMVFVSAGVRHAVGPFLKPMAADLGVDRGSFSLVIALGLFLYGAFMPWVGGLTDRFGARRITAAGSVLLAVSLVLTAYCENLWQLALVYGVLAALGLACTGPVVANAVVTRWFVRRRGTAVSLLGSAAMTGMSLLVPVVAWLIVMFDWRTAYMVLGAAVLVGMLPLCLFVVRDSPEEMGMRPDGDAVVAGRARPGHHPHLRRHRAAHGGLLAARRLVLHLRVLDGPGGRARRADAHRPRLHADLRLVGDRRARRLQHRLHPDPGPAVGHVRARGRCWPPSTRGARSSSPGSSSSGTIRPR